MSLETARKLWGDDVVERAMREPTPDPDPATPALTLDIQAHKDPPDEFARWALTQPWPRFCAIVRIVAGETRKELLGE